MPSVPRNRWNGLGQVGPAVVAATPAPPRCHRRPCGAPPPRSSRQARWPHQDVVGLAGGDHPGRDRPRVARHADDHRQARRLALAERDLRRREPQVPLGQLARADTRCAGTDRPARTTGAAPAPGPSGSSSTASSRSARRSPSPASAGTRPAAPGSRLDARRPPRPRLAVEHRRRLGAHRRPHRVAGHAQPSDDLLDRHALGPMQPTDLCPVLHAEHRKLHRLLATNGAVMTSRRTGRRGPARFCPRSHAMSSMVG